MNGAGAAAAAGAAVAQAIKASGAIVRVAPDEFRKLLDLNVDGLVVIAVGGLFSPKYKYLMAYKGLAFYTTTWEQIPVPGTCQVIEAQRIWVPG